MVDDASEKIVIERLDEIFKDVEDITDPSNMDKVLMVMDEIRIEDEEYMELLVSKLRGVTITWEQPCYQNSSCLTRKPVNNDEAVEKFETGPFTTDEKRRFHKNWRKFIREYGVPDTPLKLARWKNREKSKNLKIAPEQFVRFYVTAYLARGLKRCLYQVNSYFVQTYAYPVKLLNYTTTEEKVMEICFYHKPETAVTILSTVLGRPTRGIYKKLNQYYNGQPEKKKVRWTLELATKFLKQLMFHSGFPLKGLKNKTFDPAVWKKLEEDMEHQHKYLQAFWYGKLHVQLFVKCNVKKKYLRKIICKILQESPYKMWTDIRWKDVLQTFPNGFTRQFLRNTTRSSMFAKYPNYLNTPLHEVLDFITTRKFRKDKSMKCVELDDDGNLCYVKHQVKLTDLM